MSLLTDAAPALQEALILIIGLAWHAAIEAIVNKYWKDKDGIWGKVIYAVGITVFFVYVLKFLKKAR